ncbi:RNA polymerase sigma factor [Pseudonocardia phyllosphaerae]|uniref:RNA polymerase sigma factor n=1 Tax=Pseudonocardia phyllosphaerae TaxID=3390502 RepID=UPI0039792A1B
MAQRHGADGGTDAPAPAAQYLRPEQPGYGGPRYAEPGPDAWTGGGHDTGGDPISGAMVQQHPVTPHDVTRADFGAHLETHYPRLVAQLYAITLDPQAAHDAVQDAYSRAWRRWSDLRSRPAEGREDAALGWVRRVAVTGSKRGRLARALGLRGRRGPAAHETDPRTGALLEALGRLEPEDRRAVVLHHMAGLPLGAIAEFERVPEQTVQHRLAAGREIVTEGMAGVLEEIVGPPPGSATEGGRHR